MQAVTTIGLDIAKSVFQIHGVDAAGNVIVRRQLKRRYVLPFFQKLPPCLVGIEACASSHHWSRELQALGHTVRLMPPAYVKPYVKRHKNDAADAEAICEAVTRANMRFVAIKTPEQQSCLMLHRTRHLFIRQQTAVINAIRAHLAEFGIGREHPRWEWLSVGSVLAAVAWLGSSGLLSFYLANFANYDATYGSILSTFLSVYSSEGFSQQQGGTSATSQPQTAGNVGQPDLLFSTQSNNTGYWKLPRLADAGGGWDRMHPGRSENCQSGLPIPRSPSEVSECSQRLHEIKSDGTCTLKSNFDHGEPAAYRRQ
jgi:Transposase/Virulence factor BrkB